MGNYKYEKLSVWLTEQIDTQKFQTGDKIPTELELAEMFQISRDTVRTGISKLEDQGLLKRVKGSGTYVTKKVPFSMHQSTSKTIGIIMPETENYIFPAILNGINQELVKYGYTSAIHFTANHFAQERQLLKLALDGDYAGLVIEPTKSGLPNPNMDLYTKIASSMPALLMHAKFPVAGLSAVTSDDKVSGYIMTKYLLEQGHKNIALFCKLDEQTSVFRYDGYLRAFQDTSSRLVEENVLCFLSEDVPYLFGNPINPRTIEVLKRCSVVICHNDHLAYKLHNFAIQEKINIKIVGFDNSPIGEGVCAATVAHPQENFGQMVAQKIIEKIKDPLSDSSYDFSPELLIKKPVI